MGCNSGCPYERGLPGWCGCCVALVSGNQGHRRTGPSSTVQGEPTCLRFQPDPLVVQQGLYIRACLLELMGCNSGCPYERGLPGWCGCCVALVSVNQGHRRTGPSSTVQGVPCGSLSCCIRSGLLAERDFMHSMPQRNAWQAPISQQHSSKSACLTEADGVQLMPSTAKDKQLCKGVTELTR